MYQSLCDDVAAGKFERIEDAMSAQRTQQQERWTKIQEIIGKPRR